ncbi:SSS family solute:Na+ symporter [Saccharopolyspora erythraea NRRL 2338]|uniref:Sodium:solute symporter n=2 Tax=Saccharopolyspora erythraea TaxID=1836 RepID=A4FL94_SACEN|nr:sodium:solute symporter [Saccharopolyspora erythraea]EQD85223.1 sodium:solute symporter [Saccharopolyspora erythraea D]PFG98459.1 SSS family solute:Na+ symporter [Saccharopolyspora erythraea NRRL 2338]QRK88524.1 sodium:solute symporter [Saccharopolyspora erythraea]CAM04819.1 putative sodium:solute symporter [Saccharopolyspora erythraea NRRL 2338]
MVADYLVIALYIAGMVGVGWYGMRLARTKSDYLVAGRRLGWFMYSGTMSAIVLGGASTIGGVGLGYTHGISGAWLVLTIGLGILLLHALFARRLVKLRVYTVSEMLDLRYGGSSTVIAGVVMWGYTLMLTVTSTLSFATIFNVLFQLPSMLGIAVGGSIVVLYSVLGGMWSITLTDIAQFVIKTIGIMFLLLPVAVTAAGGFGEMSSRLDPGFFRLDSIGGATIFTYVLTYGFGLLIGQDIWQRVFTARSPKVATAGGIISGVYCLAYGFTGALIGTAARVLYPNLGDPDDAFATVVEQLLPSGVRGLVLAAALSALMSTSSGALIACSTVSTTDILAKLRRKPADGSDVSASRMTTLVLGIVAIGIAMLVDDVVNALTVAYNVLVGGLLVAILGGLVWKRGTRVGAVASMVVGSVVVIASMIVFGLSATEPIYYGLGAALLSYVVVSLLTPPTEPAVLRAWTQRLAGVSAVEPADASAGNSEPAEQAGADK